MRRERIVLHVHMLRSKAVRASDFWGGIHTERKEAREEGGGQIHCNNLLREKVYISKKLQLLVICNCNILYQIKYSLIDHRIGNFYNFWLRQEP